MLFGQVCDGTVQPIKLGVEQGQFVIVDQSMSVVIDMWIGDLFRDQSAIPGDKLLPFREESNGFACGKMMQEEEAGIYLVQPRRVDTQGCA